MMFENYKITSQTHFSERIPTVKWHMTVYLSAQVKPAMIPALRSLSPPAEARTWQSRE